MDQSHLDRKYFIDSHVYNCPFCNRNNVKYSISDTWSFDWDDEKKCFFFVVTCSSCDKYSFHLSHEDNTDYWWGSHHFQEKKVWEIIDMDSMFFFHQPTSFFTIDSRINKKIRDLISEAEWCLKMNYLVWSSACLRKAIYELIALEKSEVFNKNWHVNYQDSIKKLKQLFPNVQTELFDAMGQIQELISDNIHEKSWWKRWDKQIKSIISLLKEILYDMYVIPAQKKERFNFIPLLKSQIKKDKPSPVKKIIPKPE